MSKSNNTNAALGSLAYQCANLMLAARIADGSRYIPAVREHLAEVTLKYKLVGELLERAQSLVDRDYTVHTGEQ